jgi:hypothetical protein
MGGNAASAATNIEHSLGIGRNVLQNELAVVFLGAGQVAHNRLDAVVPIAVMQILRADEMPAGEKAGHQTDLLPGFPFLATDRLRTNKKRHLGLYSGVLRRTDSFIKSAFSIRKQKQRDAGGTA